MGVSKKVWLDRRSRKLQRSKDTRKKYVKKRGYFNNSKRSSNKDDYDINWGRINKEAPKVFSFIMNPIETISFFCSLITDIKNGSHNNTYFLNSENVVEVTTDALVYIITIIRNIKINRIKQYRFVGNLPNIPSVQDVYIKSGFFNYVKSTKKSAVKDNDVVQIICGTNTDQAVAKEICLFAMDKLQKSKQFTRTLFVTLIELMSNVVHHAYNANNEELMNECWYLYAEYKEEEDCVQIIFVDTGLGIANTVRKNFWESINLKKSSDSTLIASAFNGDFRTETKKRNRGLGLPAIKQFAINGELNNFTVVSGKGSFKISHDSGSINIHKNDYDSNIYGTIYSFQIQNRSVV